MPFSWLFKPKGPRKWDVLTGEEEADIFNALAYAALVLETLTSDTDPGYRRLANRIKADPVVLKKLKEEEKNLIYSAITLTAGALQTPNPVAAYRLERMVGELHGY